MQGWNHICKGMGQSEYPTDAILFLIACKVRVQMVQSTWLFLESYFRVVLARVLSDIAKSEAQHAQVHEGHAASADVAASSRA